MNDSRAAMNDSRAVAPPTAVSVADAVALALAQFQAGNRAEVESLCLKVMEVEPENPDALHLTGVLAHLAGKQGIALALIEKAVRLNPAQAQFQYNLGVVYGALRRTDAALAAYRAAAHLEPAHVSAWLNLGNGLLESDQIDEAIAAYQQHLQVKPHDPAATLALAIALYSARRFDLARTHYERSVALAFGDARAHWEYAHWLLMTGDFARGWEEYEYRFDAVGSNVWNYPYPFPRWEGEPLDGKTIILHGEQGLGDEIMFASIYPEVIAEARHAIICCQPHLAALFRTSFPEATIHDQLRADEDAWTRRPVSWLNTTAPIHYQIPFGSLPRLKRRALADFSRRAPGRADYPGYLRADAAKVPVWAGKLGNLTGKRVGLCWAANPAIQDAVAARRSRKKSLTLQALEPLLDVTDVNFVSLQTWEAARQVADAAPATRARVLDVSADLQDFSDTAALMMNLDLVITVDTSVAHLAGALGRPVWILLPRQADWRWHDEGGGSEWYPSARLYRQPALNDWGAVVNQVKKDLRSEVKG
jgi:Flp pilus assembly protein TadD